MSEQQTETPTPSPLDGWTQLQVVGKHLPDPNGGPFKTISEAQARGHDTLNPVTGTYQIAVVIDGHPVVVLEEQAAQVGHLTDAAKQAFEQGQQGQ